MSEIDSLLSQIPLDQIASSLGVDRATAEDATRKALPALFGGLEANATDPAGAASLAGALEQHDSSAVGADLDKIDTDDGQKIVHNIFGDNTNGVISTLGSSGSAASSDLISRLLPMLAPIVMGYLASKMASGGVGSIFGGGAQSNTSRSGGGLSDILGGILGRRSGSSGGGLEDVLGGMLGGLLGGGKR